MRSVSEVSAAAEARGWTLRRANVGWAIMSASGVELGPAAWHAVMGHDPRRCVWRCRCGLSGVRANL